LSGDDSVSGDGAAATGAAGTESRRLVHVVAGVLCDAERRVLLAQRPPGKHLAGGWEFPGGKLEVGETRAEALIRELQEELGISVTAARPLMRVQHAYPQRDILLDVWIVTDYDGVPAGLDGQTLRWCPRAELAEADLLPADAPIVTALALPERLTASANDLYEISEPSDHGRGRDRPGRDRPGRDRPLRGVFCSDLEEGFSAVAAGADFLVTRAAVPDEVLAALCAGAGVPVFARGIALEDAWQLGATGVCG